MNLIIKNSKIYTVTIMPQVKDFLTSRKIKHLNIKYKLNKDGKKELDEVNCRGCREFEKSYVCLMGINSQRIDGFTTMGIDTNVYHQIDVDDKDLFDKYFGSLELESKTPYYLSVEKKLPHFIVKFINTPLKKNNNVKTRSQIKSGKEVIADILTGFWAWCPIEAELINSEMEPLELDYNFLIDLSKKITDTNSNKKKDEKNNMKRKMLDKEIDYDFDNEENEIKINCNDQLALDLLSKEISDDYQSWCDIGYVIYNLYEGNYEEGLNRFHKFSQLSNKYKKEDTDSQYSKFKDSRKELTMGTVIHYLKTKNPLRYEMYKSTIDSLTYSFTDGDYAKRFYNMFKEDYVCAYFKPNDCWFHYENGIYKEMNSGTIIEELIKELVLIVKNNYCQLTKLKKYYEMLEKKSNSNDPDLIRYVQNGNFYRSLADSMYSAYEYCDSARGQSNIYKCSKVLFYDSELLKKLNSNINLLSFEEYVFDLTKIKELKGNFTSDELENLFRKSTKEDYVSVKTSMTKNECLESNVDMAISYLKSVFPTPGQYEYMLTLLSDSIYGKNRQRFCVNMGIGKNSKSLLQSLMKRAFGGYFGTMKPSFITAKDDENCSSANSELYACRYVRSLWISEPPENKSLNGSRMKLLAGNDAMTVRELYKASEDFTPQFSIYINCNKTFKLESCSDISLPRRIKFNPFTQFFTKTPDPKNKSHSLEDSKLENEEYLVKLSRSLMKLLLIHYVTIDLIDKSHDVDLLEPQICKDTKKRFIETGDSFQEFFDQGYELTPDNRKNYISVSLFYSDYVNYCRNYQYKPLSKNLFVGKVEMLFVDPQKHYFNKTTSVVIDGKKRWITNVFKGIKEKDFQEMDDEDVNSDYDDSDNEE